MTLEEEAAVLRAFVPWMDVVERLTEDEWVAALLRPQDSPPSSASVPEPCSPEPWAMSLEVAPRALQCGDGNGSSRVGA